MVVPKGRTVQTCQPVPAPPPHPLPPHCGVFVFPGRCGFGESHASGPSLVVLGLQLDIPGMAARTGRGENSLIGRPLKSPRRSEGNGLYFLHDTKVGLACSPL